MKKIISYICLMILYVAINFNLNSENKNFQEIKLTDTEIDKELLEYYKKNKVYSCDINLEEKMKKVKVYFSGDTYIGYIDEKKKPHGEWIINNFIQECYLNGKKIIKINKTMDYFDNDGYFYEVLKEDNSSNVYISKYINGEKYDGEYSLQGEKVKLLNRNVEYYKKQRITVEEVLKKKVLLIIEEN